jgi:hypothetical protein
MNYPVCPYCCQSMIRNHERDGTGWRVVWECACQPDPEIVEQMERKIEALERTGTKITLERSKQWVRS